MSPNTLDYGSNDSMLGSELINTKNNHSSVTHVANKKKNSKYKHLTHFLRDYKNKHKFLLFADCACFLVTCAWVYQ